MNRILRGVFICLALASPLRTATAAPDATESSAVAAQRLKVVMQVDENNSALWNLALNNMRNVQRSVGAKNADIELVAFGPGLDMLKDDSVVATRVQEALAAGVHVVACRNTMEAAHLTEADMISGIGYVQAGVVEIIRKQAEGYGYLRP